MKKNKLFSVLLSIALMFGFVFTAFSFPTGASAWVMDENSRTTIAHQKSSDYIPFSVTAGYSHLKVYVKNRG